MADTPNKQHTTGPRCGNNPNFQMSNGDRKAVNDFKARLALQAAAKPYIDAAVWADGDPLMETIAVTLWQHCARDDKDMPQAVCDDLRTIAAFAAAVACAHAAVSSPPPDQTALRDRIAEALYAHDHPSHVVPLNQTGMESAYRESAAAVLAELPPPAARAALLLEAAEHLLARCPHLGKPDALRKCTCPAAEELLRLASQEPGAADYASAREAMLRRLAAEAQEPEDDGPARVRALHRKASHGETCVYCAHGQRLGYDTTWPCDTIRALDGTEAQQGGAL